MENGKEAIISRLIVSLASEDWSAVAAAITEVEGAALWPSAMLEIRWIEKPLPAICNAFHVLWTERGHRIREQLPDDSTLFDALRVLLPPYVGAGLTLYRGESAVRHAQRAYGTAWTSRKDVAAMFASGLNAIHESGGVLLSTTTPAAAIIAGPSPHSVYLGEYEYVVDRRQIAEVIALEWFPQIRLATTHDRRKKR